MQSGPGTGTPLLALTNKAPARNTNSRQQEPRHAVIMVDSIPEARVPPPGFLLLCLQMEEGNLLDSIQLLPEPPVP